MTHFYPVKRSDEQKSLIQKQDGGRPIAGHVRGRYTVIYSKRLSTGQNRYGANTDGGAHWRHLANTIEPSVCGGDAALCQTALTTCYRQGLRCTNNMPFRVVNFSAATFNAGVTKMKFQRTTEREACCIASVQIEQIAYLSTYTN